VSECPKCHAIYEKVEKWLIEKEKSKQLAEPITRGSEESPPLIRRMADKILPRKGIVITVGIIILVALFFRYSEEYIQGRLYRYDRFTWTVQQKSGSEWVPRAQFKSLQHARDFMARWERNRQNDELESKIEALKREQEFREIYRPSESPAGEELRYDIIDLKDTIETMKMEQQHREMDRQNEQRTRDMKREFEEREREYRRNSQDRINSRR